MRVVVVIVVGGLYRSAGRLLELEADLEKIVTNWLKMSNAPAISPTEVAQKLSHFKQVNLDG